MRKATLLIAVLLCFGLATAFAGPVQVEPEYEAEASAAWGVQLDDNASGFKNEATSTIMFTFIEEQTAEYGEGTTYGYIEVADFQVEFEAEGEDAGTGAQAGASDNANAAFDISVGEITGKVFFGPAYLVVYDGADDAVDEASFFSKIAGDGGGSGNIIDPATSVGIDPNVGLDPDTEYGGVAVGFEVPDLVTVELGVASAFDWDETDGTAANEQNAYVWSATAEVTPVEMATVTIYSNMWHGNNDRTDDIDPTPGTVNNPASIGLSAEYGLPLSDDLTLTPVVGFDVVTEGDANEDQNYRWEVGGAVQLLWPGLGLDEDADDHIDFLGGDEEVTSGVTLGAVYGSHPVDQIQPAIIDAVGTTPQFTGLTGAQQTAVVNYLTGAKVDESVSTVGLKLGFYEDSGDDGFLPVIGAAAMVNYNMVMANDNVVVEDASLPGGELVLVPEAKNDLGLALEVNADLGVVSPYAGVIYEIYDLAGNYDADSDDAYLGLFRYDNSGEDGLNNKNNASVNIGTDVNVIPNTTFTIDYSSGNLLFDEEDGVAWATQGSVYSSLQDSSADNTTSAMAGALSIETTIEF